MLTKPKPKRIQSKTKTTITTTPGDERMGRKEADKGQESKETSNLESGSNRHVEEQEDERLEAGILPKRIINHAQSKENHLKC